MSTDQPRDAAKEQVTVTEEDYMRDLLRRICDEFGIGTPLQLIARAENDGESYGDILIKIIRERIARATAAEAEVRDMAESAARTQETFERVLDEAEAERRKAEAALAERESDRREAVRKCERIQKELEWALNGMEEARNLYRAKRDEAQQLRERGEALARAGHDLANCADELGVTAQLQKRIDDWDTASAAWREIVPAAPLPDPAMESGAPTPQAQAYRFTQDEYEPSHPRSKKIGSPARPEKEKES